MLNDIDDNSYHNTVLLVKAMFHIYGCVSYHKSHIWGAQEPHEVFQYVRDSFKVNVWYGFIQDHVISIIAENTIIGFIYLDMLVLKCSRRLKTLKQKKAIVTFFARTDRRLTRAISYVTISVWISWLLDWPSFEAT